MSRTIPILCLILPLAACVMPGERRPDWPYPEPPSPYPEQPSGDILPGVPDPRPTQPPAPGGAASWPSDASQDSGPAVMSLIDEADAAAARGEFDQAAAILERAQRIEPRNPWIWQRLAQLRLMQGQYSQAESLAERSNSLSRGNPWLRSTNWGLIAEARSRRGDHAGAEQAREQQRRAQQELPRG